MEVAFLLRGPVEVVVGGFGVDDPAGIVGGWEDVELSAAPVVLEVGRVPGEGVDVAGFGDELPGPSAAAGAARAAVAVFALGDEDHVVVWVGRARGGGGRGGHLADALDEAGIAFGAGRVGVGRARVVGADVVGQGMAAGVEDGAGDGAAGSDRLVLPAHGDRSRMSTHRNSCRSCRRPRWGWCDRLGWRSVGRRYWRG